MIMDIIYIYILFPIYGHGSGWHGPSWEDHCPGGFVDLDDETRDLQTDL